MLKIKDDGLPREQIHDGITGSESCLQGMKRRLKIYWIGASIIQDHYIWRKIILGKALSYYKNNAKSYT